MTRIRKLTIELDEYAKDENGKYFKIPNYMKGKIEFENELGSIEIKVDNKLCNAIVALCLNNIAATCSEQIKQLQECFENHAKEAGIVTKFLEEKNVK